LDKAYEVFGTYKRFLSAKINLILVIIMGIKVKARYENEMLKPLNRGSNLNGREDVCGIKAER
jgi:hypothetical protein